MAPVFPVSPERAAEREGWPIFAKWPQMVKRIRLQPESIYEAGF
jgi:hypothetical protein